MALHIASPKVDALARELQALTGERLTTAIEKALEECLARLRPDTQAPSYEEKLAALEAIRTRARADAEAVGFVPPTKQELEEMLGLDEY